MFDVGEVGVEQVVIVVEQVFLGDDWVGMIVMVWGKLLLWLVDLIVDNVQWLVELEICDIGKIICEILVQIVYVVEYYCYYVGLVDKIEGVMLFIDKLDMEVWLRCELVGVVVVIVLWNLQLFLFVVKIGLVLVVGCIVVFKVLEEGFVFMLEFVCIFDQVGFFKGVLNVIIGGFVVGVVLMCYFKVVYVVFIGGLDIVCYIVCNLVENLVLIFLELGGKFLFIVFEDVDIDSVVNVQILGIFVVFG